MKRLKVPLYLLTALASTLPCAAPASPTGAGSTMSGGTLPLLPPAEPPATGRDPAIPELPFLLPSPPEDAPPPPTPPSPQNAPQREEGAATNPFSSLVPLPPPSAPQPPQPEAPAAPSETAPAEVAPPEVVAPEGGEAPAPPEPILAPLATPRPPPSPPTNRLPRTLNRARARAPSLLSRTLGGAGDARVSRNPLAEVAAVRLPSAPGRSPVPGLRLEPLGGVRTPAGAPLTGDANEVADDLRAVSFTGVVTGTGVFRVAEVSAPVLLSVGQALPDTDIVLTALSSSRAVFTRNDERHTLSLRP